MFIHVFLLHLGVLEHAGHRRVQNEEQADEQDDNGEDIKACDPDGLDDESAGHHAENAAVIEGHAVVVVHAHRIHRKIHVLRLDEPARVDDRQHQVDDHGKYDGLHADVDHLPGEDEDPAEDEVVRQQKSSEPKDPLEDFSKDFA